MKTRITSVVCQERLRRSYPESVIIGRALARSLVHNDGKTTAGNNRGETQ